MKATRHCLLKSGRTSAQIPSMHQQSFPPSKRQQSGIKETLHQIRQTAETSLLNAKKWREEHTTEPHLPHLYPWEALSKATCLRRPNQPPRNLIHWEYSVETHNVRPTRGTRQSKSHHFWRVRKLHNTALLHFKWTLTTKLQLGNRRKVAANQRECQESNGENGL